MILLIVRVKRRNDLGTFRDESCDRTYILNSKNILHTIKKSFYRQDRDKLTANVRYTLETQFRKMLTRTKAVYTRRFSSVPSSASHPVVELREYTMKVDMGTQYMLVTKEAAELRKSMLPLRLFSVPETGGTLNIATHFYYYGGGMEARDAARLKSSQNADWVAYLQKSRPCLMQQASWIFSEPQLVKTFSLCGMECLHLGSQKTASEVTYEIRRYQLKLGYDTVPKFLEYYSKGLPSKLSAKGTDSETQLCTVLNTEVGNLNHVIEIWRHGAGSAGMHRSRLAARSAKEWREAINSIGELTTSFQTTLHKPTGFSSWM